MTRIPTILICLISTTIIAGCQYGKSWIDPELDRLSDPAVASDLAFERGMNRDAFDQAFSALQNAVVPAQLSEHDSPPPFHLVTCEVNGETMSVFLAPLVGSTSYLAVFADDRLERIVSTQQPGQVRGQAPLNQLEYDSVIKYARYWIETARALPDVPVDEFTDDARLAVMKRVELARKNDPLPPILGLFTVWSKYSSGHEIQADLFRRYDAALIAPGMTKEEVALAFDDDGQTLHHDPDGSNVVFGEFRDLDGLAVPLVFVVFQQNRAAAVCTAYAHQGEYPPGMPFQNPQS